MSGTVDPQVRELYRDALDAGWTPRPGRRRGHLVLRCPCGEHSVPFPSSAGSQKLRRKVRVELRRCTATRELIP